MHRRTRSSRTADGPRTTGPRLAERLRARGWLDGEALAPLGLEAREAVEEATDRLAAGPVDRLGPDRLEQLFQALRPLVGRVAGTGAVPYPNPIGLTPPE